MICVWKSNVWHAQGYGTNSLFNISTWLITVSKDKDRIKWHDGDVDVVKHRPFFLVRDLILYETPSHGRNQAIELDETFKSEPRLKIIIRLRVCKKAQTRHAPQEAHWMLRWWKPWFVLLCKCSRSLEIPRCTWSRVQSKCIQTYCTFNLVLGLSLI